MDPGSLSTVQEPLEVSRFIEFANYDLTYPATESRRG